MTSQFKEKAVRLGKLMNGKSKFAIPLVQCILDCFEIVYTEEEIDCMLLMGAGYYTKEELIALLEKNYEVTGDENVHTFEALYKSSEVHAFSEYRGFTSYDKFYKTYNNQKKMKSDLDACKPMSNREMMQKCISFVENNFENFLSKIKMDKQLFRVIVGELSKEASELTKKREQTEAELRSISDSKLNYWERYRIDYELFKKGILKGVV